MSRVTLALGSFIVGVCFALLIFSLIHTFTPVQAQGGLGITGAEPVVPPLSGHMTGVAISGALQQLDGIDCDGCTIEASTVTYAGGAFRCNNCSVKRQLLQLRGAAFNTLTILQAFGAIPPPPAPPRGLPRPAPEIVNLLQITPKQNVTVVSLQGIK
jgi:hypothetical protein